MAIIRLEGDSWKFETGLSEETAKSLKMFIIDIVFEKEELLRKLKFKGDEVK
ncbi:MAG: hypothetical protein KJ587_20085 [Alphaproteobacteria bacterium]|nr:hypothetical protein [Alphaproteobacteria bacterium]